MTIQVVENKATELMNCLLLQQYHNSPNLKEYLMCYFEEFNILFAEIQRLDLGRQLECAEGVQLDIIGDILGRNRNITVTKEFFGFINAPLAQSFGDLNNASVGGFFKDLNESGATVLPIDDGLYRNLLKARAYILGSNNSVMDIGTYDPNINTITADDLFKILNILVFGTTEGYQTSNLLSLYSETNGDIDITIDSAVAGINVQLLPVVIPWITPLTHKINVNII